MKTIFHCLLLVMSASLLPAIEDGTVVRSVAAANNETNSREEDASKLRVFFRCTIKIGMEFLVDTSTVNS